MIQEPQPAAAAAIGAVPADAMAAIVDLVVRTYPGSGNKLEAAIRLAVDTTWAAAGAARALAHVDQIDDAPSILISPSSLGWRATAVLAVGAAAVDGPSTSFGKHPADALQHLLGRRFGILADQDLPATVITIGAMEDVP
ncbi:hypothetical protein [Sphingomonas sp. BK235]|uniref:hypothetical protein n=1 Tax=Sphingomonas sp. BK235 TaxID=2512131 RepID=UPI00104E64A6|nr:hypothetical protein [Sphingomonas sp. BK235]TCP30730.1 hypothetical protein EV292_11287 [Sphingomonas sp. BK235]